MKKHKLQICAVALIAALTMVFSGCSGSGNAYMLYQSAVEKLNATDDIDMSMDYVLNMQIGDFSSETKMKADIMGVDMDSNPVYLLYYDTTVFTTTVNAEVYYADGVAYVNTEDRKYKQEMSVEELMEEHGGPILQMDDLQQFMSLSKDDFDGATTTSEGGITKITLTMPGETLQDVITEYFQDALGSRDSFGLNAENLSVSDGVMTYSLNQDTYFTGMTLDTDITLNMENGNRQFTMGLHMEISFNNPGNPVEIVPPNGLDQYEEYTSDNGDDENIDEGYTIPEDWRR